MSQEVKEAQEESEGEELHDLVVKLVETGIQLTTRLADRARSAMDRTGPSTEELVESVRGVMEGLSTEELADRARSAMKETGMSTEELVEAVRGVMDGVRPLTETKEEE